MVDEKIIPVDLQVYDLDANQGLYVPNSNFTEFLSEAGSRGIQQTDVSVNNSNDLSRMASLGYEALESFLNSGKQALSKELKRNKAKIKYNTQVILVNGNNG